MIYAGTISIPDGDVVEIFTELGVTPGRYTVSLHADGIVAFAQDATPTSTSFAVPTSPVGQAIQFITDHDPVYMQNLNGEFGESGVTAALYVLLTAVV